MHPSRSHPRAKFGFEAMRLATFYQEVGGLMFEASWDDAGLPSRKPPLRSELQASAPRSLQVVEQLSLALASGQITAACLLSLPPRAQRASDPPIDPSSSTGVAVGSGEIVDHDDDDDSAASDDDLDGNSDDEEKADPPHRHYPLAPAMWDHEYWPSLVTDWTSSQLSMDIGHICVVDTDPYRFEPSFPKQLRDVRSDLYSGGEVVQAPVVVLRAELALRKLLPLSILPEQTGRYSAFQNRLFDEVVLAAWRALALKRPPQADVNSRLILKYINEYLNAQNIDGDTHGLSEKSREAVALKLVRQWSAWNTTGGVLQNSTPVKPLKAATARSPNTDADKG